MKNVDKLLRKAKTLLERTVDVLFSDDADGFLDCLGVDPELYRRDYSDGTVGYDFLAALADTAKEDWEDHDDDISPTVFPEDMQENDLEDSPEEAEFPDEPWKCPWWNSLARTEKQEILMELGIAEDSTEEFMEYINEQPKKKEKSRKLFGWG